MNIQELQKKYLTIYESCKNVGVKNKVLMLFLTFPATLYAYFFLEGHRWERFMPHWQIVVITISILLVMILMIISIKSISFINSRKARSFKYYFKTELFDCIKNEIPEICDYVFNQKIHPKIFYNSNLFKSRYSDYIGDDWIRGCFDKITFEMCELHVFNLFKNIFCGIFVKIGINTDSVDATDNIHKNKKYISDFEGKYKAKVLTSCGQRDFFVAIKMNGKFFEADNPRQIKSIDAHVLMLKDMVDLIKIIAGANETGQLRLSKKLSEPL
jgi:hypothetical protein